MVLTCHCGDKINFNYGHVKLDFPGALGLVEGWRGGVWWGGRGGGCGDCRKGEGWGVLEDRMGWSGGLGMGMVGVLCCHHS